MGNECLSFIYPPSRAKTTSAHGSLGVCVCVLSISISTSQCHHAQFQLAAAAPQMMWILQSELAYHAAVVSDNCQKAYEISQAWPETNRGASLTRLLMIHQR